MKIHFKTAVMSAIIGAAVTFGVFASASDGTKSVEASFKNIRMFANGKEVIPTDAAGNETEPFIYNDKEYVPLRAASEALGMKVTWDAETKTVYMQNNVWEESRREFEDDPVAIAFIDYAEIYMDSDEENFAEFYENKPFDSFLSERGLKLENSPMSENISESIEFMKEDDIKEYNIKNYASILYTASQVYIAEQYTATGDYPKKVYIEELLDAELLSDYAYWVKIKNNGNYKIAVNSENPKIDYVNLNGCRFPEEN